MFVPLQQEEKFESQLSRFLVAIYFTTTAQTPAKAPKAHMNGGLHCFIAAHFIFSVS